ncbi:Uncharacterized protein FWK35_00030275, partial [Aphis craccivora]
MKSFVIKFMPYLKISNLAILMTTLYVCMNDKMIKQINVRLDKIQDKYYWPTLTKDTTHYIKSCHSSKKNKKINGKPIAACNNTKFIFTKTVESATAQSTINFIIQIIFQWECFRQLSPDRDIIHIRRMKPHIHRNHLKTIQ